MNSLIQITLGVVTAVGGFVDIGELVFSVQAGSKFGYTLLWAVIVGTIGIITYSEMSGRVAAVIGKPVFALIKQRFPNSVTLAVLVASTALNALTCAAEIGGVAIALQLLTGLSNISAILLTCFAFIVIIWTLPFKILEKVFGILGLFMLIFIVVSLKIGINTESLVNGFIPSIPHTNNPGQIFSYFYFAVGIISSSMMPYEVYFYSSGGVEEKWKPKDLMNNKLTAGIGMTLGGLLAASLIIVGSTYFAPHGIFPQLHGTAAMSAAFVYGKWGLILALLGIIFAVGGATVETSLAGAYNISQYFGWQWGRHKKSEKTRAFSATWISIIIFAFVILLLGIDPVDLVEYAVIFSVIALPFTYYPILKVADDKKLMREHANGFIGKTFGWIYFVIICILAISAIPLMILSNMGKM